MTHVNLLEQPDTTMQPKCKYALGAGLGELHAVCVLLSSPRLSSSISLIQTHTPYSTYTVKIYVCTRDIYTKYAV